METIKKQEIPGLSEWRFEAGDGSLLKFRLVDGTAEIFGAELAKNSWYEFSTQKAAVFSWRGAVIEWQAQEDVTEYMSDSTPMATYGNLHLALESKRKNQSGTEWGPSVLILGPAASGKTSLAKILAAYATKQGSSPLVVSLDPQSLAFGPPGALSSAPAPILRDVTHPGWGNSPINGPTLADIVQPVAFYYGLGSVVDGLGESSNSKLFRHCVSQLALAVGARFDAHSQERASGLVIDTPAELAEAAASGNADAHSTLARIMAEFRTTVIAVVGSERLYADLKRRYSDRNISLLSLPRSGGVVVEDPAFKRRATHNVIQHYFYGTSQPLSPFTTTARFSDLTVYRVSATTSKLGAGAESTEAALDSRTEALEPVEISAAVLQNAVLAVVQAPSSEPLETVPEAEILGFVHISHVDDDKKLVRMLLPVPGKPPGKVMILGELRYFE